MAVLPPDPVFTLRQIDIGGINCVCFHGTDRLFCGTSRGSIYLWDLQVCKITYYLSKQNKLIYIFLKLLADKSVTSKFFHWLITNFVGLSW